MGKRIISQRRGSGTSRYKSPSHRFDSKPKLIKLHDGIINGKIIDIMHSRTHSSPLIEVDYDGTKVRSIAPIGVRIGDSVVSNSKDIAVGNTLCLKDIPEGSFIFNIESKPGDGGKFVRGSGCFAKIMAKNSKKVVIIMPSKKKKEFSPLCRAVIGVVAGGGRLEKPFVKAGAKFFKMRVKNKLWPRTEGVKMNAVDHPFGNSRSSKKGRPTIARKHAPAGAKVGKIRPSRTGKKMGRIKKN
ncbi:MAG: 50S ribosomal protein L2 [Candidatus Woesearchaeota archaeon]